MSVHFDEQNQDERLLKLHKKEEEELARVLSAKYGAEYIDLTRASIDTDALRLVKEEEARFAEIAAFRKIGKKLFVAMRAPHHSTTLESLRTLETLGYTIRSFMVSEASLEHAWERYKDLSFATASEGGVLNLSDTEINKLKDELKTIRDVSKKASDVLNSKKAHHVSHVLEIIISGGLALDASDVHIEPEEEVVKLRYRIDGVLTDVLTLDHSTFSLVSSRIKLLSGMKLNIKNMAQDGRYSIKVAGKEMEIRSSIIPGPYGESIVMRILDPSTIALSLNDLGMDDHLKNIFLEEIQKPNGMILNTGPTGSGKTTTLYAFLSEVNRPGIKIITLENPIEYHLSGVVQTQITKNYTFASGLRAILRQDPDVIMVGEIRDHEVASTAVHAALTGHLVFSTLHTNNAAGTFPRIIDIGVSPEIIGASITVAMAQRLARKLCKHCRVSVPLEGEEKNII